MRLSAFLPAGTRVAAASLKQNVRDLVAATQHHRHQNARVRHTKDELELLRLEALRERELLHQHADDKASGATFTLRVRRVERTTPDAVSIFFEHLGYRTRGFVPGQFLLVHGESTGSEASVQRAYSIITQPGDDELGICVRCVAGGALSTRLQHIEAGDTLRVSGPHGRFTLPEGNAPVVLVAGGVGITPLVSIAGHLSAKERGFHLLYASRDYEHIVLRREIEGLLQHNADATCAWVLDTPQPDFAARTGPPDEALFEDELPINPAAHYLLCGPEGFMARVRAWLVAEGVPDERILQETFVDQSKRGLFADRDAPEFSPQPLRFAQSGREVVTEAGQTLLEAGLNANIPMPFSCTMGGCAACRVRLLAGEVHMQQPNCLTDKERDEGYCLACIARPLGPVTIDR